LRLSALRLAAVTVAAQVRQHEGELFRQLPSGAAPGDVRLGVAVQQRQRRPFAAGQRLVTAPGAWMLLRVGLGVATKPCREPGNRAESAKAPDPPAQPAWMAQSRHGRDGLPPPSGPSRSQEAGAYQLHVTRCRLRQGLTGQSVSVVGPMILALRACARRYRVDGPRAQRLPDWSYSGRIELVRGRLRRSKRRALRC